MSEMLTPHPWEPLAHGDDFKAGGISATDQNPEQLESARLHTFQIHSILTAQENSLGALPEWILNDASRLKGIPKKVSPKWLVPVRWRAGKNSRVRRVVI